MSNVPTVTTSNPAQILSSTPQPKLTPQVSNEAESSPQTTILPTPTGKLVLNENFEKGTAAEFIPKNGLWEIVNDSSGNKVYRTTVYSMSDWNYVEFSPANFSNGTITYRFKVIDWDPSIINLAKENIFFRVQGNGNFDSYTIQVLQGAGILNYVPTNTDNSPWPTLSNFNFNLIKNKWNLVRLEIINNHFKVYFDDQPVIDTIDNESRVKSGRLGFETGPKTTVDFDDVKVWQR
jgi:hypothetical protein